MYQLSTSDLFYIFKYKFSKKSKQANTSKIVLIIYIYIFNYTQVFTNVFNCRNKKLVIKV